MIQTVKYARHRAAQDPDHGDPQNDFQGAGVYFGTNLPREIGPAGAAGRERATRGACVSGVRHGWTDGEGETGMTITTEAMAALESGKRAMFDMAGRIALEFGATAGDVYDTTFPDVPGYGIRVLMPNGYGVTLAVGGPRMVDTMDAVGCITVRNDGESLRTHDFRGAMGDRQYGVTLDDVRGYMRALPLN